MKRKSWPKHSGFVPDRLSETAAVPGGSAIETNVRSAKDKFSSLLKMAAEGTEIVITRNGEPQARMVSVRPARKRFKVDWALLRATRPRKGSRPAEKIIREERDSRP